MLSEPGQQFVSAKHTMSGKPRTNFGRPYGYAAGREVIFVQEGHNNWISLKELNQININYCIR